MSKINFLRTALLSALVVGIQGTLVLADTTSINGTMTAQSSHGATNVADTSITSPTTTKATGATTAATKPAASKIMTTGDIYTVDAASLNRAQGSSGGAETLFSQNIVAGLVPGVMRFAVGSGPGYGGQGQLSMRGGAPDQIGYMIEGVPVNRAFDFYNGTSFNINGVESLQICTGGAPAG
jgi:hypothetical protein